MEAAHISKRSSHAVRHRTNVRAAKRSHTRKGAVEALGNDGRF